MIRFRFVEDHRGVYDVKRMCALVEVPRSSFYAWTAGPSAAAQARQAADAELAEVIEQVWRESRRTYGWPRVWGQLTRRRGMTVSRRRVARIMREHGFVGAHSRRSWRRGRPDIAPAADHLQRVFTAERPNHRWVADITEFPTGEGKLHLAAIRDLCHRGIVGWSMDEHQDAQLVVDALTMAPRPHRPGARRVDPPQRPGHPIHGARLRHGRRPRRAPAVVRLDRGLLRQRRDGDLLGHAQAGGRPHPRHARNLVRDPRPRPAYLFEFIEVFYNRQRHQTGLGHRTPAEYAAQFRERP